jgi:hypothetical protein
VQLAAISRHDCRMEFFIFSLSSVFVEEKQINIILM